jgi:hypothetical protein
MLFKSVHEDDERDQGSLVSTNQYLQLTKNLELEKKMLF